MEEETPDGRNTTDTQQGRKISLNFADKDDKENAKFNDARLVDILRNYPLLYNKSLESYGDPDYTQWMWGEVANEMNEPHRKTTLNFPFHWIDCRDQWEVVKRALRYLSNPAAKSFRYPKQFRECLEFFQNYIKDRREPTHTDRSQDLFLHHVTLLEQLPFEKQLSLEKEVLNVILSNELEFCAPMVDPSCVEKQAREDFAKVIGLLMPEVDVHVVQNELATDSEPFVIEDLIQKPDNPEVAVSEPVTGVTHLLNLYPKSGIALKPSGSQYDLGTLLQVSSKRVEILVPQIHGNIQFSLQGIVEDATVKNILQGCVAQEGDLEEDAIKEGGLEGVLEEDIVEEGVIQVGAAQEEGAQELVLQECVFQEDAMQEDLIEEVVPQGPGKDMPSLDIEGHYEVPENRIDLACVLNEMLE